MTYPPESHILRDLQIGSVLDAPDRASAELEVVDAVLDASGVISVGALVTLADVTCARVTLRAAAPSWTATVDLSLVSDVRPSRGVIRAEARVTRVGSRIVVDDVDLGDAGTATSSFAIERIGAPLAVPVVNRMGIRASVGTAELDNSDSVRNSFGTINGGVLGFLVVAAAESETGRTAADVTLRCLGQTQVGPACATARVVRAAVDHDVVDVTVRDVGSQDMLLARALVTVM